MDRLTRHELKQDDFRETIDTVEDFLVVHLKEILTVAILVVVLGGLAGGLKYHLDQQQASANVELASAMRTFQAYVGAPSPGTLGAESQSFPTAGDKYKRAKDQFNAVVLKYRMYPRPKAATIALYYVGICDSLQGNSTAAISTLQEVSRSGDREVAALAQFALAGELLKTGKKQEAITIYQSLVDHPSLAVPKASAQLAMADGLKDSQPGEARKLYDQVQRQYGTDLSIADAMKQRMAGLPQ